MFLVVALGRRFICRAASDRDLLRRDFRLPFTLMLVHVIFCVLLCTHWRGTMTTELLKTVGMREFRDHLAEHISGETPLAITRHGLTIGYYIPAHRPVSDTDLQTLEDATRRLHALLADQGIDPEDLIHDYAALRKTRRPARGKTPRP